MLAACTAGVGESVDVRTSSPTSSQIAPNPTHTSQRIESSQKAVLPLMNGDDDIIATEKSVQVPPLLVKRLLRDFREAKECIRERYSGNIDEFISDLNEGAVEQVDLNNDGKEDFILRLGLCGGASNAPTFVYQSTPNNYRELLKQDAVDVQVLRLATNGFQGIRVFVHVSAEKQYIYNYEYGSSAYRAVDCGILTYTDQPNGEPKPQISPTKCSELD